ncbi:hypothetical protein [Mucilaginibacter sp.]
MRNTRRLFFLLLSAGSFWLMQGCHENPNNTFGGASNHPQDTAASRRDTSSVSTHSGGK